MIKLLLCIIGIPLAAVFFLFIWSLCVAASKADDAAERTRKVIEADRKADTTQE